MISVDDFKKIEVTLGTILSVERVPDTDKLLRLEVDFGPQHPTAEVEGSSDKSAPQDGAEPEPALGAQEVVLEADAEQSTENGARDVRQVVSGIALYLPDPQVLVGRTVPFVTNLEPRKIRGLESQAMIFAASTDDGLFSVLEPTLAKLPAGTRLT